MKHKDEEYDYCVECQEITAEEELQENAKYGSYGWKRICDKCANEIDHQMDSQQQDKYE